MSKARNISALSTVEVGATADQTKADLNAIGVSGGRKNIIINGGFDVWQRGTSFTTSAGYTADRWQLQLSGGTSTVTRQTFTIGQTEVPDNPTYYLKANTTTGNNNCGLFHPIEDVRNGSGKNVTVSFWAKGTNPAGGVFDLISSQRFGAGGSSNVEITTPLTITSSWVKYTHTFSLASISGKTIGTGSSLTLIIRQHQNDTGTAAWELNLANVQVELGSVATDFEHRSYGEELRLCERYFYRYQGATQEQIYNENNGATAKWWFLTFPQMRATPSATFSSGWVGGSIVVIGGTINSMSVGGGSPTAMSFRVTNSGAGGTVKSLYHTDSFSGDYCYLSAEL